MVAMLDCDGRKHYQRVSDYENQNGCVLRFILELEGRFGRNIYKFEGISR